MNPWWNGLGLATAMASAALLYVASPNCRWPFPRRWSRGAHGGGVLLAVLSLAAWIIALGPAVGTCAMLATWMLSMVALPYLALSTGTAGAGSGGDA